MLFIVMSLGSPLYSGENQQQSPQGLLRARTESPGRPGEPGQLAEPSWTEDRS